MRIGILTLPLHTNYGGILQAYALQTVLERMGHEVFVITELPLRHPLYMLPLAWLKRAYVKWILKQPIPIFYEYEEKVRRKNVDSFVETYIQKHNVKQLSEICQSDFDAIVVGSDQIWRPHYYPDITHAFLDFTTGWKIKRISYAASFGVDVWEFSDAQTKLCAELLHQFDIVTVREEKGVQFCAEYFVVSAKQVLDPTLLLDVEDYITLFQEKRLSKSPGNLMCYVLDETNEKKHLMDAIAHRYSLSPFMANVQTDNASLPLAKRIQPPVEQFLRGFYDAEFVVTDSFHACIFSILFNKPFFVFGNMQRGLSRFTSLLSLFSLEDRLILSLNDISEDLLSRQIDWNAVNSKLISWRNSSRCVLSQL